MKELFYALTPDRIDYTILFFLRVTGLIFSSPIFGRTSVPGQAKVALSLSLTILFLIRFPQIQAIEYSGMLHFALICGLELVFGVILGVVTTMFFSVVFTAGNIIDTQMGFGMVNVYDPQSATQVAVTGNLFNIILLLCFFAVDGHSYLIHMLYQTFDRIPVGNLVLSRELALIVAEAFTTSFLLSIHVAMPFIASGLLAEAALGVIIRTVPQMNMFVVGIPLKVLIGFVMLMLVIPIFVRYSSTIFDYMFEYIEMTFTGLMEAT